MNERPTETILPWYRYRWPWLLMLGPFLVIVAAAITVYLAVVSSDGLVDDDYYKQGLAINQISARDLVAANLGLQAEVMRSAGSAYVRVLLSSKAKGALSERLNLHITHPTRAGVDQNVLLISEGGLRSNGSGVYSGKMNTALKGRWHVVLEDENKEWRLTGDWPVGEVETLQLVANPERSGGQPD